MQLKWRDLLWYVCVFMTLTISTAENKTCLQRSDNEICYIQIEKKISGSNKIHLENPRKTLKCESCEMTTLIVINSENSNLVETIDFSESHIKNLTNSEGSNSDFGNVCVFNLSHNEIEELRFESNVLLTSFKKLKTLDLSHNNIQLVPSGVFQNLSTQMIDLENLVHLNLSFNAIDSIDDKSFHNLGNLKVLNLSNNRLHTFDTRKSFSNISKLINLDLSNNYLTRMDILYANNLRILHASGNRIISIHILGASALKILDVSNNSITNFFCEGLKALRKFYLANNTLTRIQIEDILSQLPTELQTLHISFNQLNDINASTLAGFNDLRHLNLQHNGIHTVNSSTFAAQPHLTDLILDDNVLTDLDVDHVSELFPSLKRIGISNNAWSCSYLIILIELLNAREILINSTQPLGDRICDVGSDKAQTSIPLMASLISNGILGIFIVLLGIAIFQLHKRHRRELNELPSQHDQAKVENIYDFPT